VDKRLIMAMSEALETNNTSAIRQIGRESDLEPEALITYLTEAAGQLYARRKEPQRAPFFDALMTLGRELDSPAIAWGILERKRRENLPAPKRGI